MAIPEQPPKVSIVIPIYREAGFVERALDEMVAALEHHRLRYEILLIEQSSDEPTVGQSRATADRHPHVKYTLLPHPDFGLAMRLGMLSAAGELIVNFDIDYWDITFVRMCLAIMLEFDIDLVIGSKNARLSVDNRAFSRRLVSQVFRLVLQTAFGLRVSDTHGIKAWRRSPALIQQIRACRFNRDIFDTELVIRGERAGLRLLELPVTVAEQRKPRSSIFARVPGAVWSLVRLYFILWRESPKRSVPLGAVPERHLPQAAVEKEH